LAALPSLLRSSFKIILCALFATSAVFIFGFSIFMKLIKPFFFITTGANFRGKQGELHNILLCRVVYFAHDKNQSFLSSALDAYPYRCDQHRDGIAGQNNIQFTSSIIPQTSLPSNFMPSFYHAKGGA
jgi:hypothetical protein